MVADASGRAKRTESFQLAASEDAFWAIAARPASAVTTHQDDFVRFLRRVMEQDAPLSRPRDLAWTLAAHARTALQRIEHKGRQRARPAPRGAQRKSLTHLPR